MCILLLFDVFKECSSSIKEINVNKYIKECQIFTINLLLRTDILKTLIFSGRKFEEMH